MKIFNLPLPSTTAEIGVLDIGGTGVSDEPPHETKAPTANAKTMNLNMCDYFRM